MQSWSDEYLKRGCGFVNANGERIVIGVGNDGMV